jgi:hypothetical protein
VSDAVLRETAHAPCWHLPRHRQRIWNGTPLEGRRVLVRCYHGLGDTIQFIRYAPLLRQVAAEVIVWAQESLIPVLRTVRGIDRLLPLHEGAPKADYDVDVEVMELPHVFRTTLATIPSDVPYIRVPSKTGSHGSELAVGVAWKARDWNPKRCVPPGLLALLSVTPGIALYVLQDRRDAKTWPIECGFPLCPEPVDMLAQAIAMMDLVITVDSLPAHLGGALGVPTWTMLPTDADWRWMEERDDSPWYPTMRLWRQEEPGEWEPVVARVARELARVVRERPGTND